MGWAAEGDDDNPWIEVDLLENKLIGGIVTWPRADNVMDHYVKTFNIQYREEGSTWKYYQEFGSTVVGIFTGNENLFETVLNDFTERLVARYVRFNILTYYEYPTMRWELLGCTNCESSFVKVKANFCTFITGVRPIWGLL
ncbi:hypothetical protein CAPTEDRAFT_146150 [Capitella teleta]|uniref:F5/8 type C domain-containing protein n=1 Tax=Capitella teleta TaxID=283909 RepID=R7VGK4_CAPTE|nr:hypothetical protein CAPTEDRAFT_146150 [Capitella teleta]|eukprot:ELU17729.1 hypothetical protein CAPTEDRAFT_146150 [Capitella teleta]